MLSGFFAECHMYAFYAECRYAECRCAECRGTILILVTNNGQTLANRTKPGPSFRL